MQMNRIKLLICILVCMSFSGVISCTYLTLPQSGMDATISSTVPAIFDLSMFDSHVPTETVVKNNSFSNYEGGPVIKQSYTQYLYAESIAFTDRYPQMSFEKKVFDNIQDYKTFGLAYVYKQFLYFFCVDLNDNASVFRYNMENGLQETVFTYQGENQICLVTVNDKYIVWKEDENANWLKVSLHCFNMRTGRDKKIYTYSRDELTGNMYSWNFNTIILLNNKVYFDDTVRVKDNVADINLFEYNIDLERVRVIDESRAAHPQLYNGLSWLSFDEENNEYIIKNIDEHIENISLGKDYVSLCSSEGILVGVYNDRVNNIMYYDGKASYPIMRSTAGIDQVFCTDSYITWDGWTNDEPEFYDIDEKKIVYVDCLDKGKRFGGYVTDSYLIFEAHNYIPDPTYGGSTITTDSLVYYFIKTEYLK